MPEQLKHQCVDNDEVREVLRKRQLNIQSSKATAILQNFVKEMEVWVKMSHRNCLRGTVMEHTETPRSFIVRLHDGRIFRRNQYCLKIRKTPLQLGFGVKGVAPPTNLTLVTRVNDPVSNNIPNSSLIQGTDKPCAPNGHSTVTPVSRVSKPPIT